MTDKSEDLAFKERIELFERYHSDPDQHHKIFTELGFSYGVDNCDGYCPECECKSTCEVYLEIKTSERGWTKN